MAKPLDYAEPRPLFPPGTPPDIRNEVLAGWLETYFASENWAQKQAITVARARLCESCGAALAVGAVHAFGLAHVGKEPLWELRSVCADCMREHYVINNYMQDGVA